MLCTQVGPYSNVVYTSWSSPYCGLLRLVGCLHKYTHVVIVLMLVSTFLFQQLMLRTLHTPRRMWDIIYSPGSSWSSWQLSLPASLFPVLASQRADLVLATGTRLTIRRVCPSLARWMFPLERRAPSLYQARRSALTRLALSARKLVERENQPSPPPSRHLVQHEANQYALVEPWHISTQFSALGLWEKKLAGRPSSLQLMLWSYPGQELRSVTNVYYDTSNTLIIFFFYPMGFLFSSSYFIILFSALFVSLSYSESLPLSFWH